LRPNEEIGARPRWFLLVRGAWHWQATRSEIKLTVLPLNGVTRFFVDAAGRKKRLAWVNCGDENAVAFSSSRSCAPQGVNQV